jgi:monoamine oxidase
MSDLAGRRVGVAGAGLAGLTAAWALQRQGAGVVVFEASRRLGGRVLTVEGLPGAARGELGGDIIEDENRDAIGAVAGALGLSLRRVLPGGFRYHTGAPGRGDTLIPGRRLFEGLRELLQDEIAALKRAESNPASAIAQSLGRRSALDWARAVRRPRQAVAAVQSLRGFFLAEPSEYSLLMLAQQLSEEGDPASMKLYRIAGGNARLPERLASSLRGPVQMDSRVLAVETRRGRRARGRVTAVIDSGGLVSRFTCDAFVVAVPATLAREIAFTPALPALQQQAIATLPYGRATKALVSFDRRFWRRRGHAFASRQPVGAAWEAGIKGSGGTLAFLAGGGTSDVLAGLVAGGSQRDWQRSLGWLGIGRARVLDAVAMTWEDNPYVRGSYAHQSPSYDPALVPWLSAPAGRVAFAGEHTSVSGQGYMEGAVMSGLRAADDVKEVLLSSVLSL